MKLHGPLVGTAHVNLSGGHAHTCLQTLQVANVQRRVTARNPLPLDRAKRFGLGTKS